MKRCFRAIVVSLSYYILPILSAYLILPRLDARFANLQAEIALFSCFIVTVIKAVLDELYPVKHPNPRNNS